MADVNTTVKPKKSKTSQALDYLREHPNVTPYAAAKLHGISVSGLYRKIKTSSRIADHRCPCCGQEMPTND